MSDDREDVCVLPHHVVVPEKVHSPEGGVGSASGDRPRHPTVNDPGVGMLVECTGNPQGRYDPCSPEGPTHSTRPDLQSDPV